MTRRSRNQRKSQQTKIPTISTDTTSPVSSFGVTPSPRISDNSFFNIREDASSEEGDEETMAEEMKQDVTGMPKTGINTFPTKSAKVNSPTITKNVNQIMYILDKDLEDLLRNIFAIRNDDNNHELLQALSYDSITSWKMFRRLQQDDIETLTKGITRGRAPIGKSIMTQLKVLLRYIREKIEQKEPGARDIDSYDPDDFEEYLDDYFLSKRNLAIANPATMPTPSTSSNVKSRTEKALDSWERKRNNKTNFEILREDSKYKLWKETFIPELKVQGLERMIDPNFNKKLLIDTFDRELYERQSNYFWTVLDYSLKNPVAEIILGKHRDTSDARTAYLAMDAKMKGKTAQMYNVTELMDRLRDLHISSFNGTRVQFMSRWFETLRQLNKVADKEDRLSFIHVRSQLMRALNTDSDLTNSFTELKEEPDRDIALVNLMEHLVEKSILFDGRDGSSAPSET